MTIQHTPGPWHSSLFLPKIRSKANDPICMMDPLGTEQFMEGNTRLIVAAPQLFESLTELAQIESQNPTHQASREKALAIIKQVTE